MNDTTTRTAGDIAESIADEVLGKIRTTRLNGGAGATRRQVRGFVSAAINHRYQAAGLNVLVVPLRSGDRDRGYLELHDRLSRWDRFRDEDLRVLETLGGHVATALDKPGVVEPVLRLYQ